MAGIWKRGDGWRVEVKRRGYPTQSKTFPTKPLAEKWAREIEYALDRGQVIDRSNAERNTFGDLLKRYAEEVSPGKKSGSEEIVRIGKLRRDKIASYKITALTSTVVSDYVKRRLEGDTGSGAGKVSGSTVNRDLTLISHVINVAKARWDIFVPVNPVSEIERPKENRSRTRRLLPGEEERLLAALEYCPRDESGRYAASGCRSEWMKSVVILAIETAMRRSELLALEWRDIFLEQRFARLHDSKNNEARDVPLSTRAIATLAALPRRDGRVFPMTREAVKRAFVRACIRGHITGLRFHDLRHEAISRMAPKFTNVLELSRCTGHKTLDQLNVYYQASASELALKLG